MFKKIHSLYKEIEPYSTIFSLLGMIGGGIIGIFSPIVKIIGLPGTILSFSCIGVWLFIGICRVFTRYKNKFTEGTLVLDLEKCELLFNKEYSKNISIYQVHYKSQQAMQPMKLDDNGNIPHTELLKQISKPFEVLEVEFYLIVKFKKNVIVVNNIKPILKYDNLIVISNSKILYFDSDTFVFTFNIKHINGRNLSDIHQTFTFNF